MKGQGGEIRRETIVCKDKSEENTSTDAMKKVVVVSWPLNNHLI